MIAPRPIPMRSACFCGEHPLLCECKQLLADMADAELDEDGFDEPDEERAPDGYCVINERGQVVR